jgi:hypothetical protein
VKEKDMELKDNVMPLSLEVTYQVLVCKGVSQGAKGQENEDFTKGQEIEGFIEWQKMLLVLGEESSKVETSFFSLLKCKDECKVDLLVHNGHVKDHQKLVDDVNVKLLELQLALNAQNLVMKNLETFAKTKTKFV